MSDHTEDLAKLDAEVRRLRAFLEVSRLMNAETNKAKLIREINETVRGYLDADRFTVFFYDAETDELYSYIASGLKAGEIRIKSDSGAAGHVFQTEEMLAFEDAYTDPRFNPEVDRRTGYRTKSLLSIPIKNRRGTKIGVVQALNKKSPEGVFTDEDISFLTELIDQICDLLDLLLHKEELARQHAAMQEQLHNLRVYDYLIGEKTGFKMMMRWARRSHVWVSIVAAVALLLMGVTGIIVAHEPALAGYMYLDLHKGRIPFGGSWYVAYADLAGIALVLVTLTGIMLWGYPILQKRLRRRLEKEQKPGGKPARGATGE